MKDVDPMEDERNVLKDERPFSYARMGSDKARILYCGRPVYVAVGKDLERLDKAIRLGDEYGLQLTMAKMTGNFKRGNERKGRGAGPPEV
jgi:hypothetical protein